jgi:hypothetical protein
VAARIAVRAIRSAEQPTTEPKDVRERLLTIPEVAERLRVPRQHAYELARREIATFGSASMCAFEPLISTHGSHGVEKCLEPIASGWCGRSPCHRLFVGLASRLRPEILCNVADRRTHRRQILVVSISIVREV